MYITKIRQGQIKLLSEDLDKIREQIKTFKEPIPLLANMPMANNNDGDLRVCLENGKVYVWKQSQNEWILSSGSGNDDENSGVYGKIITILITKDNQTVINTNIKFNNASAIFQTNSTNINLYLNGILMNSSCYRSENINNELVITWVEQTYPLCINDQIGIQYFDILGGKSSSSGETNVDMGSISTNILPSQANVFNIGSEQLPFQSIYVKNAKISSNIIEIDNKKSLSTISGIKINREQSNPYILVFDETDDQLKFGEENNLNIIANKTWTEQKIIEEINSFIDNESDLSDDEIDIIINEIFAK